MRQFFVNFIRRLSRENEVTLGNDEEILIPPIYIWYTKVSMTGLATMLKSNIANSFEGVSVDLHPLDEAEDIMIIRDSLDLWDIKQFAKTISKVLAIQEFIDKGEWHEPDNEVEA